MFCDWYILTITEHNNNKTKTHILMVRDISGHKKRKTTNGTQQKETKATKKYKKKANKRVMMDSMTSARLSNDEDMFFSRILAKKDYVKETINKSIEKATEVMKDAKLEIQKCPFCKKHTATYNMMQRRSGDEGSTAEFKCKNELCARSWRGRS